MYNQKSVKNQEGRTSQKNGVIWYPSHDSVRILSSTLYSECAIGTYTDTLTNVWTVTNFSIHINSSSPLPTFWIFSSNFTCNKYKRMTVYYIASLSFYIFSQHVYKVRLKKYTDLMKISWQPFFVYHHCLCTCITEYGMIKGVTNRKGLLCSKEIKSRLSLYKLRPERPSWSLDMWKWDICKQRGSPEISNPCSVESVIL